MSKDNNTHPQIRTGNDEVTPVSSTALEDEKSIATTGQDLENQTERLPYPKSVFFIVINEFCERFTFYGMRTVLALYLRNQLHFSDATSTVIYHVFIMICYFFPLLGAILADSWLGKYKTILYLSVVYAVGNTIVSTAAIPNTLPAVAFTMIGLVLIALGTGGIKPCVSAFGGDQFTLPQQEDQLQKFFSLFYFSINSGSFVSTFLTPVLREIKCFDQDSCYSLAFGVPAILMIIAIIVYFLGSKFYKINEPQGNVVIRVGKCMWYACKKKSQKTYDHWLDKAQDKYEKNFIDDIKAALRVLVLYIPLPIFWALFDQQGSRWTFQATRMNGELGFFKIQPDQMQVVNPLLILTFIPLFQTCLYPLLAKCNLLKRPLQKLTVGGTLAAIAFVISAVVEIELEPTYPVLPKANEGQIRIYNGHSEDLKITIPDLKIESLEIKSLELWKYLHVPVSGKKEMLVEYSVDGKSENATISVYEKEATSYTFIPSRTEPLQLRNEDINKTDNGSPKVMVLYSDPERFKEKTVSLIDETENLSIDFVITPNNPYATFKKIPFTSDKLVLKVDKKDVLRNVKLEQGGGYLAFIANNNNNLTAKFLTVIQPNSVNILWLIPQYVIITAGEIMFSITGLEFSYSQAPESMKSLLQAAWLMTVALGNLIVVIIAQAKLFESQKYEFLLFAGLMFLDMSIFALLAMRYTYVEDLNDKDQLSLQENDSQERNKG